MNKPSPELRARILAEAKKVPSPTHEQHRFRMIASTAAATTAGIVAAVGMGMALHWHSMNIGGPGSPARPIAVLAETFLGAMAISAVAFWSSVSRGKSMLGRSRRVMLAGVILAPIAVLLWKIAVSAQVPGLETSNYGALGLKCMSISFVTGALPFFAVLWLRRFSDPVHPYFSGAGIGLSAGMLTWLVVDLWCPVCYVPHLLIGHVFPTVTFIVVGAVVGGMLLRMRTLPARP